MNKQDEPVTPLTGAAPVDRVILQDEVKLWRTDAAVAYLDSDVYDFKGMLLEIPAPVPVYDDTMHQIGFASITREVGPDRLVAHIVIDYATEERFEAELNIAPLYPRVFGRMALPAQPLFDFAAKLMVIRLALDGIQLTRRAPVDTRLKPLADTTS